MADTNVPSSEGSNAQKPAPHETGPQAGAAVASEEKPPHLEQQPEGPKPSHPGRKLILLLLLAGGLAGGGYALAPTILTALNTVSTDDAYVNGHVTFVAPRVSGQVSRVLVDDNIRVKKGSVLVQLDKEPYQIQVAIKQAAVATAEADLMAAQAQVRSNVAQMRAARFLLQRPSRT